MFRDECFAALARTDSACLHIQEVEQKSFGGTTDYRDYRGAVEGGGFHSSTVAASDGCARDARGEDALGRSRRPARPGKTLQGLRGEQENDSASVSGRDEDEFREVEAANSAASWIATAGLGGKGDGGGFGGGLQQSERVHIDVPEAAGDDADAVFGGWERTGA